MKRYSVIFLLLLCCATAAFAQAESSFKTLDVSPGKAIEFTQGEYVLTTSTDMPEVGWQVSENPNIDFGNQTNSRSYDYRAMFGRFFFEGAIFEDELLAIHLIGMRGNIAVSVNETEVFRNYSDTGDLQNAWYRPFLIPLPPRVLRPGTNEVLIHSFSTKSVGIGRIFIGSDPAIRKQHDRRFFWHVTALRSANFAMLTIGGLSFLLWLARRKEAELLWLSIAVVLFSVRNHQYYVEEIPFDFKIYSNITVCANYFAVSAITAFYLYFIKFPHRKNIIIAMLVLGIPISGGHIFFSDTSLVPYLATASILSLVAFVAIGDLWKNRSIERGVIGVGALLLPLASLHDIVMLILYRGDGHATYLAVFCGTIFSTGFIISFGKRSLDAFRKLEASNQVLEQSVADARVELMESEAARQKLLVTQALASERARLMQEMHDGIGSNLTTALAVARQQKQAPGTVSVLKKALGDLKLTVDSLEPVEGDIVSLIGNLRHRMARDMLDAGITCKWEV